MSVDSTSTTYLGLIIVNDNFEWDTCIALDLTISFEKSFANFYLWSVEKPLAIIPTSKKSPFSNITPTKISLSNLKSFAYPRT